MFESFKNHAYPEKYIFLKMTMNSLLLEFKFLFYKDVLQVLTNYLAFIGT